MAANQPQQYKKEVTKSDLVEYLVHTEGLTKYKAASIVNRIVEFIVLNLVSFNKVRISGLGSITPNYIKSRIAYIHFIGAKKKIDARLRVIFKLEDTVKRLLQTKVLKFQQMFGIVDKLSNTDLESLTDSEDTDDYNKE